MKRIKYTKEGKYSLYFDTYDIYARKVRVMIILKSGCVNVSIFNDKMVKSFELSSLQNAKRKVRKILKEEFEVNLGEEVRSVLCI